jgi:hypothetical protein
MFNSNQALLLVQTLKSAPQKGFTLGVKAEMEKIFSICPRLLINAELLWLSIGPQGWKKSIPLNLGSQFATLEANVLAFISNLGPNNQPKNAQSWPQVSSAMTPSVKASLKIRQFIDYNICSSHLCTSLYNTLHIYIYTKRISTSKHSVCK